MKTKNQKLVRNSSGINLPVISSKNKTISQNTNNLKKPELEFSNNYSNIQKKINVPERQELSRNMVRTGNKNFNLKDNDMSQDSNNLNYTNPMDSCNQHNFMIPITNFN